MLPVPCSPMPLTCTGSQTVTHTAMFEGANVNAGAATMEERLR